jgi:hypothetical protein
MPFPPGPDTAMGITVNLSLEPLKILVFIRGQIPLNPP